MTFNFQYLILIIVIVTSLSLGLVVFLNNKNRKINQIFSLLILCMSIWIISNFLVDEVKDIKFINFLIKIDFASASLVGYFFFLFCIGFQRSFPIFSSRFKTFIVFLPVIFITLLSLFSNLIVNQLNFTEYGVMPIPGKLYFLYSIYLFGYIILGFLNLVLKYKKFEGIRKTRTLYVILGLSLSAFLALITNLVLPEFIKIPVVISRLGIYGFLFFIIFTSYAIVQHELMDIKVVLTEVLVGIIGIIMFAEIFASRSPVEYVARTIFFLIVAFFGYLLVKSVLNEIRQKEKLAKMTVRLKKANDKLKELDKLKDEFLNIASHELGTPLSGIAGYLSMIIDEGVGKLDKKAIDFVTRAYDSSRRMARLIKDLLNVSRIEQKRLIVYKKPYNLEKLTEDAVSELSFSAKEKGIELEYKKPKESFSQVFIDIDKIKEVILNTINNAIKYTDKGKVSVGVRPVESKAQVILNGIEHKKSKSQKNKPFDKTQGEPKYIKFSVKDSGIGIPKDDLAQVFEKFNRGSLKASKKKSGSGLGLYISRGIIKLHNGDIWTESEVGKGSKFSFILPIITEEEKQKEKETTNKKF